MDILNKACRGYVWGEMYVAQIWQVIDRVFGRSPKKRNERG